MSERDGRQAPAIQRPSEEDTGAWEVYWKKHGQPWRREPEIDPVRQDLLKRCLVTKPELRKVMYPYQGMKLSRADVEWLLSTHESGGVRGPVDFSDERQRTREGLDIRGALLHEEDLSGLPLARIRGGLSPGAWSDDAKEQKEMAAVHLQKADLRGANLQGAILDGANLEEADLDGANLQKALLIRANLQGAILEGANLQKAFFWAANLQEADLTGSSLEEAFFEMANLQKAKLGGVNLQKGKLRNANLQEAWLGGSSLEEADLRGANLQEVVFEVGEANLQKADLSEANLQKADLRGANLQGAILDGANLEEADLRGASLQETDLRRAQLKGTYLEGVTLGNEKLVGPQLGDSQWSDVNHTLIKWSQVKILGDEYVARKKSDDKGKIKKGQERLSEYEVAVRANRELSVVLRDQGLNEAADHFAYRAQILQRSVLWLQIWGWPWIERPKDWLQQSGVVKLFIASWQKMQQSEVWKQLEKLGRWIHAIWIGIQKLGALIFSKLLDLLTGYGYKPGRILFWYVLIVSVFAMAYYQIWSTGHLERVTGHTLSLGGAVIFSITAFHGRGFFLGSGTLGYDSLIAILGAVEAVIGLFIELSFIATFTGRFFRR